MCWCQQSDVTPALGVSRYQLGYLLFKMVCYANTVSRHTSCLHALQRFVVIVVAVGSFSSSGCCCCCSSADTHHCSAVSSCTLRLTLNFLRSPVKPLHSQTFFSTDDTKKMAEVCFANSNVENNSYFRQRMNSKLTPFRGCLSKALKAAHICHLKPTLFVWHGVV